MSGTARADALGNPASTPSDVLRALADRCEREEPSDKLDREIWCVINHDAFLHAIQRAGEDIARARSNGLTNRDDACVRFAFMSCPRYTTSLEAAVTLVPEDHIWRVGGPGWAVISAPSIAGLQIWQHDGRSMVPPRPALALCAAALRARASILEQEGSPTSSPDGEAGGTTPSGGNNT